MFRVLDLFSGIGGFSLGLERTGGFETVAFCEIDPFCRKVLAKHWPKVKQYHDVRTLTSQQLSADGIIPDVICGGFPCQDISTAGKGAGIEGERSGLWSEYARLIGELRPRFVIVENVAALLGRGLDKVLGDLAEIGFDAEWHCIPASAVGAPHRRDRLWLVANSAGNRDSESEQGISPSDERFQGRQESTANVVRCGSYLAHADIARLEGWLRAGMSECADERVAWSGSASLGNTKCGGRKGNSWRRAETQPSNGCGWLVEPNVGRVAHGVPKRVDRLRALGNAVVPQIPELIGHAILQAEVA